MGFCEEMKKFVLMIFVLVLLSGVVSFVGAQSYSILPDSDYDGILNNDDVCPLTPHKHQTNKGGCSVLQLCWEYNENNGKYTSCVVEQINIFSKEGILTKDEKKNTIQNILNPNQEIDKTVILFKEEFEDYEVNETPNNIWYNQDIAYDFWWRHFGDLPSVTDANSFEGDKSLLIERNESNWAQSLLQRNNYYNSRIDPIFLDFDVRYDNDLGDFQIGEFWTTSSTGNNFAVKTIIRNNEFLVYNNENSLNPDIIMNTMPNNWYHITKISYPSLREETIIVKDTETGEVVKFTKEYITTLGEDPIPISIYFSSFDRDVDNVHLYVDDITFGGVPYEN